MDEWVRKARAVADSALEDLGVFLFLGCALEHLERLSGAFEHFRICISALAKCAVFVHFISFVHLPNRHLTN